MHKEKKIKLSKLLFISGMSKSTYYFALSNKGIDEKNNEIKGKIIEIFNENKARYGVRRVYHELLNRGYKINHKKVQRLMKCMGLHGIKQKQKYHSYQGHVGVVADNILKRQFKASKYEEKWTTDVSQFTLPFGKCFLSPIMDMFDNEIISYDLSKKADYSQIERMLSRAELDKRNLEGLIFHSDQGWQYQNPRFVKTLADHKIRQSMSRKGNCMDNSIMESFFGVMKNEMFYGHENDFKTFEDFEKAVNDYIFYYNNIRIKQKDGWMSPVQYRILNGSIG